MKKAVLLGLPLILMILFMTACGVVSQKDYIKVSSDLAAAQVQIQSLQSNLSTKDNELNATQAKVSNLENENSGLKQQVADQKKESENFKAEVARLKQAVSPPPTPTAMIPLQIPHTLEGRSDCLVCHNSGEIKPFPQDHAGRTTATCLNCHRSK